MSLEGRGPTLEAGRTLDDRTTYKDGENERTAEERTTTKRESERVVESAERTNKQKEDERTRGGLWTRTRTLDGHWTVKNWL